MFDEPGKSLMSLAKTIFYIIVIGAVLISLLFVIPGASQGGVFFLKGMMIALAIGGLGVLIGWLVSIMTYAIGYAVNDIHEIHDCEEKIYEYTKKLYAYSENTPRTVKIVAPSDAIDEGDDEDDHVAVAKIDKNACDDDYLEQRVTKEELEAAKGLSHTAKNLLAYGVNSKEFKEAAAEVNMSEEELVAMCKGFIQDYQEIRREYLNNPPGKK